MNATNNTPPNTPTTPGKPVILRPATHRWVLIVEDDDDLRSLVMEDLKRQGYRAIDASTVSDAIQKIKNQKFDCIVLDLKIDQRAGEEVIEFLRGGNSDPLNRATPILIVSGFVDVSRVKRLSPHVSGVLVKPFDRKALLTKIQGLIDKHSPAPAGSTSAATPAPTPKSA